MSHLIVPVANATYTKEGIARIAGNGVLEAGFDEKRYITAVGVRNALNLTTHFESAEQLIVNDGNITLAHGLLRTIKIMTLKLVCKVAENGATVGQEFHIDFQQKIGSTTNQGFCKHDNNNIYFKYPSATLEVGDINGEFFFITPANWRLIISAWA